MSLNLINDAWIPVLCKDGTRKVIAPWQMTDPVILAPDWPRPDLNIACYEMLIGLVYLADPPANTRDWDARASPDPERLRAKLSDFSPAFNLLGESPRFLQDPDIPEGDPGPADMLFIDSSGANTAKNNADLMVRRGRYPVLDLPLAGMALYTFQNFAPSGGAGNRTSMRGGGPLVTLADPGEGLWSVVWANVPCGQPSSVTELPWMRPVRHSDKGLETDPPGNSLFGAEAFFGMPRRLRLIGDQSGVKGVLQKPYGTNYARWKHPLSPYYRMKPGSEWLPKHPRAGRFGYRNWLGIIAQDASDELSELSLSLRTWNERSGTGSVIVAGWAMDNMKPRDFTLSIEPIVALELEVSDRLVGLIKGAEGVAVALRGALAAVIAEGEAREAEREAFFLATESQFATHLATVRAGGEAAQAWLNDLQWRAFRQFDVLALPGLAQRETDQIQRIVQARKYLGLALSGYGKQGRTIFDALGLPLPDQKRKAA